MQTLLFAEEIVENLETPNEEVVVENPQNSQILTEKEVTYSQTTEYKNEENLEVKTKITELTEEQMEKDLAYARDRTGEGEWAVAPAGWIEFKGKKHSLPPYYDKCPYCSEQVNSSMSGGKRKEGNLPTTGFQDETIQRMYDNQEQYDDYIKKKAKENGNDPEAPEYQHWSNSVWVIIKSHKSRWNTSSLGCCGGQMWHNWDSGYNEKGRYVGLTEYYNSGTKSLMDF